MKTRNKVTTWTDAEKNLIEGYVQDMADRLGYSNFDIYLKLFDNRELADDGGSKLASCESSFVYRYATLTLWLGGIRNGQKLTETVIHELLHIAFSHVRDTAEQHGAAQLQAATNTQDEAGVLMAQTLYYQQQSATLSAEEAAVTCLEAGLAANWEFSFDAYCELMALSGGDVVDYELDELLNDSDDEQPEHDAVENTRDAQVISFPTPQDTA